MQTLVLGSERFDTGGNAFHLLHHAIASGFTELVPPLVRSGALVYVGMSAGAHLAAPQPRQIVPVTNEQLIVVRGPGWSVIPAVP